MVQKIVDDIRAALNNDLYFVALSTALTLPDICGKAEYPDEKSSKKRYIDWNDKEIGYYEKNPHQTTDEEMPYLSGSVIYSLRCSLLHEGNPNVDNDRLTQKNESLPKRSKVKMILIFIPMVVAFQICLVSIVDHIG